MNSDPFSVGSRRSTRYMGKRGGVSLPFSTHPVLGSSQVHPTLPVPETCPSNTRRVRRQSYPQGLLLLSPLYPLSYNINFSICRLSKDLISFLYLGILLSRSQGFSYDFALNVDLGDTTLFSFFRNFRWSLFYV